MSIPNLFPFLLASVFLFGLNACSSVERCTGEFAANSDWDLLDGTTWPEDISYCQFQTDSIQTMAQPWKKAQFDHYSGAATKTSSRP